MINLEEKNNIMNKYLKLSVLILLVTCTLFVFIGCSNSTEATGDQITSKYKYQHIEIYDTGSQPYILIFVTEGYCYVDGLGTGFITITQHYIDTDTYGKTFIKLPQNNYIIHIA